MTPDRPGRLPLRWLAPALVFPAAVSAVAWHFAVDVPFWDLWDWLDRLYGGGGAFDLSRYWPLLNEHRVFVPLLVDRALFEAVGVDLRVRALLKVPLTLVTLASLIVLFHRTTAGTDGGRARSPARVGLAATVFSALLFSMAYWPMWADPRNYAAHMAQALTVLGVTVAATRDPGWRAWLAAATCSLVAGLSTTVGTLAWPLVLAVLWWRGYRRRHLLLWTVAGAVAIAPHALDLILRMPVDAAAPASLKELLKFALAFFGRPVAPVVESLRFWPSMAAGAAGLACLACVVAGAAGRRGVRRGGERFPWYALAAWALTIGVLATIGRSGNHLAAVHDARFVVAATPFWVVLAALVLMPPDRTGSRPAGRWRKLLEPVACVLALVGYLAAGADAFWSGRPERLSLRLATGKHCLADVANAPEACLQLLHPIPAVVRRLAPAVLDRPPKLAHPPAALGFLGGSWGEHLAFEVRPEPPELPVAEARFLLQRLGDIDRVPARAGDRVVFPIVSQTAPASLVWRLRLPAAHSLRLATAVRGRKVALFDRWRTARAVAYLEVTGNGTRARAWRRDIEPGDSALEPVVLDLAAFAGQQVEIVMGVEHAEPASRFSPRPVVEWLQPDVVTGPDP